MAQETLSNGAPAPNGKAVESSLAEAAEGIAHRDVVTTNGKSPERPVPDSYALATRLQHLSLGAQTLHADGFLNSHQAIAPPMHVSTTFRYNRDPDKLESWRNENPNNPYDSHVYSRATGPNSTRIEAILTSILHGPSLSYSSGLSAFHAMLVFLNPKRIAIRGGYHGCHGVINLLTKLTGLQMVDLDCDDSELQKGDVLHVETPLNPTGEARNLEFYAEKAKRTGAILTVDATFAPPPLLDPFLWGADIVMHSGTKYFGGHSDLLCGVLAIAPRHADWIQGLILERLVLGSVLGSLEGWLGVRSLRTLELRVKKQSHDVEQLVRWLTSELAKEGPVKAIVKEVKHASLQTEDLKGEDSWLKRQMPNGFGPVFSILTKEEDDAKRLPSKLYLFEHATSLGGVESLIEWRAMSDKDCDKRLLRVSIGIEGWEELRDDLLQAFEALAKEKGLS